MLYPTKLRNQIDKDICLHAEENKDGNKDKAKQTFKDGQTIF